MNTRQREILEQIFLDQILDSEELRTTKPLSIQVFSNTGSTKIPFKLFNGEQLIGLFVIDYNAQELLKDCYGYNEYETYLKINCEDFWKGFEYTLNEILTKEFNDKYERKE